MTRNQIAFLCEKLIEKCNGDLIMALDTLQASAEAYFSLGDYKNAEKLGRVLDYFRRFYV